MSVDSKTVRHIARLARIALAEEQVEPMAKELDNIISWVEQLNLVDVSDVPPLNSVISAATEDARGRGDRRQSGRRADGERTGDRGSFLRGAKGRGVGMALSSSPRDFTLAEARDALRSKKISSVELTGACVDGNCRGAAAECLCHRNARARVCHGQRVPTSASQRASGVRSKASRSRSRICSARKACARRPAVGFSRISYRPMN